MKYLLILIFSIGFASSFGQNVKQYDLDKDGILQNTELRALYISLVSTAKLKDYFKTDGTLDNGLIDGDYLEYKAKLLGRKKYKDPHPNDITIEDVEKDLGLDSKLNSFVLKLKVLVRASHEDITLMDPAKGFDKAEAAVFSYTRNYLSNTYGFLTKGAIMKPITLHSGDHSIQQIVPSITFNRVKDPKDSTKNANTLVTRVGYNLVLTGGEHIGSYFIKAFGSYATDFNFKSKIYAAELEGEIAWTEIGIGTYQPLLFLEVRYNIVPHAEYGIVKNKGEKQKLVENDPFFRAGPKLSATIRPKFLKSLELTTSYTYLWGLKGSPNTFENFSQKANYSLDSKKRFSLSLEYNKGKVPLTLDEIENLIFGISIKL